MIPCPAAGQRKGKSLNSFPFRKELSDIAIKCKEQLLQQARPPVLVKLPIQVQIVVLGCLAAMALRQSDVVKDVLAVLLQIAASFKDAGVRFVAVWMCEVPTASNE